MRKIGKKREKEQSTAGQFRSSFHGLAREALWNTALSDWVSSRMNWRQMSRHCVASAIRTQEQLQAVRAGHVPSSLVLGMRRVEIQRPPYSQRGWLRAALAELAGVEFPRPAE